MSQTILVVDDEPTILTSLQGVLEDEGFQVATASDGPQALSLVEESAPIWSSWTSGCRSWTG